MSFSAVTIYNLAKSDSEELPSIPRKSLVTMYSAKRDSKGLLSSPQKVAIAFDATIFVAIIVLAGVILANALLHLDLPGLAHTTNTTVYILIGSASFMALLDLTLFVIQRCRQSKNENEPLPTDLGPAPADANNARYQQLQLELAQTKQLLDQSNAEVTSLKQAVASKKQLPPSNTQPTPSPQLEQLQTKVHEQAKTITTLQAQLAATELVKRTAIQQAATARDASNVSGRALVETHDKKVTELQQTLKKSQDAANEQLKQAELKTAEQAKKIAELQAQAETDKEALKEVGTLHRQLAAREVQTKNLTSKIARLENDLVDAKYELYKATHGLDDTDCVKSDTVGVKIYEDDKAPYIKEEEATLYITSAQAALMRQDHYFSSVAAGKFKHDNDSCLVDNLKVFLQPDIHKLSLQADNMGSILLEDEVRECLPKFEDFFVEINLSKDPVFVKTNLITAREAVEKVFRNLEFAVMADHKVLTMFWLQALESHAPLLALIDSFNEIATAAAGSLTCAHYLHEMMFNCLLENATDPIAQAFAQEPANKGLFKIETLKMTPFLGCVAEKKDYKFEEQIDSDKVDLFFELADLTSLQTVESTTECIFDRAVYGREIIGRKISSKVDSFGCLLHHQSTFGRGAELVKCNIDDTKAKLIDYTARGNPWLSLGPFGKTHTLFRSVTNASGGGVNILYRDGCEKELAAYVKQAYCLNLADFQNERDKYFTKK